MARNNRSGKEKLTAKQKQENRKEAEKMQQQLKTVINFKTI